MNHHLEHINQDIKKRLNQNKDSIVYAIEYQSKRRKKKTVILTIEAASGPIQLIDRTVFVSSWCVNLIRVFLHDDTLH